MGSEQTGFSTRESADEVIFRLPDASGAIRSARVWLDLEHRGEPPLMRRRPDGWELRVARPPVQRLEYLFAVEYADGGQAMICDPAQQARAATPFGDHSVIEFPGYRQPGWLTAPYAAGSAARPRRSTAAARKSRTTSSPSASLAFSIINNERHWGLGKWQS